MTKYRVLFLLIFISINFLGQRNEFVIIENKTYIKENNKEIDLSYLCENLYDNKRIFLDYTHSVFAFTNDSTKKTYYLKQWNTKIKIFIDTKVPKKISIPFFKFVSQFKNINNLSIEFVKKVKDANYLIEVSDKPISAYEKEKSYKNKEEKEADPYIDVHYNLLTDNNNKFYSGKLFISKKLLKKQSLALKKMKQLFFVSLGNFVLKKWLTSNSLLSFNYIDNDSVIEKDLEFLKLHYSIIYENKINGTDFKMLRKKAEKYCEK